MLSIVLMRHGRTEGNLIGRYNGRTDEPLCAEGISDAEAAPHDPAVALAFASPLRRTQQTAKICFPNAEIVTIPDLREMDFGDFEMKSYAELKDDPAFQTWCQDAEHNACPHGESAPQVLARNLAAIQPVLDAGEDAVCVIHGGVTAGLLMQWFGGIRYDYPVAPGTGYQVTFEGGKPVSYRPVP